MLALASIKVSFQEPMMALWGSNGQNFKDA